MLRSLRLTRSSAPLFPGHFSLALFLVLLAVCSLAFISRAGRASSSYSPERQTVGAAQCPTCKPPTQQVIYAPLLDVAEASSSEIVLNCRSTHVVDLMPIFYTIEGTAVAGEVIHLQPAEMRFVETKSLIPASERNGHRWGGISFSFMGNTLEAWAQLTLHGIRGGGSTNILFTVLGQPRPYTSEAVWWIPRGGSALLALGNSSDQPVHANLNFSNGASRSLDIAPFATEIIRPRFEDLNLGASNRNQSEAVSLNYTGAPGSLIPTGFVSSADGKFASLIRFYNTPGVVQPNLFATNLRLKDSQPHLVLRNTSSGAITVRPRFLTSTGNEAEAINLPTVKLAPYEVTEINLKPLMAASARRPDLESVSVQVINSGVAGSLIGALYSTNMTTGISYDVPLRDSGPPNASAGAYPVRLDGDYTTVLSITNVGNKAGRFSLQINYQGGAYILDAVSVNQGETKKYDIRKLRDEQTADREGHPFPRTMEVGQIRWSMLGDGSTRMAGRAEVVSVKDEVSSSYSCAICCQYSHFDGWVTPSVVNAEVGGTSQFTTVERQRDCYGNLFGPYPVGVVDTWWSDNETIATINYNGLGTAVGGGQTAMWASYTTDTWREDLNSMCEDTQGTDNEAADMNVAASVGSIQYQSGSNFVNVSSTLYVLKGTSLTFKAIPNPANASFASGKPVWSGTSGASGTGQTTSVTFNNASSSTSDFKTVTATSGNTMSVNVIVYDLTGVFTPANNLAGRSLVRFGIEEQVSLSIMATPAVTASQIGGVRWRIVTPTTGGGTLAPADDGTATYNAPDTATSVSLQPQLIAGPSMGGGPTITITIVEPSGGYMTRGSAKRHFLNTWSTGFLGSIHIQPEDVSFYNLFFYEGSAPAVATGWLSNFNDPHPQSANVVPIESTNTVHMEDKVYTGRKDPPFGTGQWYWDIPWHIVTNSGRNITFMTARELATSDDNGTATITKGGATSTSLATDPTQVDF